MCTHRSSRIVVFWLVIYVATLGLNQAIAADWPTHRHDNYRSGKTPEKLNVSKLEKAWTIQTPWPPQQAWAGPAKWDAYRNLRGLKSMRNYDPVFQTIVVGDSLFYGNSVDDSLRCVDTKTGNVQWTFTTDGPIRIAPTYHNGNVYVGSDDGHAYCIHAKSGNLVWKFRPVEPKRLIINNGRFIPHWPIRTGILVDNGIAYFAAGMLPWKSTYLCAVSPETGKIEKEGHYVQKIDNATIEGPMLCSVSRLVAPQGRIPPVLFDRKTGKKGKQLGGGGGVFVLVTKDDQILHGPGNKTGWITSSNVKTGAKLAAFSGANAMVVHGNISYILTDRNITAINRKTRKTIWTQPTQTPYELILANDTLFAGGKDVVVAFDAKTGKELGEIKVFGRAYGLVAADGALFVSTDEGEISCFRPTGTPTKTVRSPKETTELAALAKVTPVQDKDLIARYVFHRDLVKKGQVQPLKGKLGGDIIGETGFTRLDKVEALTMNQPRSNVVLADNHNKANLPTKQITATAWVRVDEGITWGGIVGAFQDNGNYERGWVLGYNGERFSMGVSSQGNPRLTYLAAKQNFQRGGWYHVAGVYDGKKLSIYVNGKLANSTSAQKGDINYPPKAPYVIGAYRDDNEFFSLKGAIHEVRVYERALKAQELAKQYEEKRNLFPKTPSVPTTPKGIEVAVGPYLRFTGRTTAEVLYETKEAIPTKLRMRLNGEVIKINNTDKKTTVHNVTIDGLRRNTFYTYNLGVSGTGKQFSKSYECDNFFNYTVQPIREKDSPWLQSDKIQPRDKYYKQCVEAARRLTSSNTKGICLVYGIDNGQLAFEIARQSQLRVICLDTDAKKVNALRQKLLAQERGVTRKGHHKHVGWYGSRITAHHVKSLDDLPFTSEFANLVVSERAFKTGKLPGTVKEVQRVLQPGRGIIAFAHVNDANSKNIKNKFRAWGQKAGAEFVDRFLLQTARPSLIGVSATWQRPPLKSAGVWSHLYGLPDNSAYAGEKLGGARGSEDLSVQWIGRPGPRANPDRNGRKPSPLATNGRLFVQGLHRLISIDAYNGTILWSLEIPPLARFNMPRDCSNWCADADHIYLGIHEHCWKVDARTGKLSVRYEVVPALKKGWEWDWGYIARTGHQLIGTAVKKGTSHTNFFGGSGSGWYDARGGEVTYQICSDNIFSMKAKDGSREWKYEGVLLNPTITIGNGKVYFVECRHPKVKAANTRRVGMPELWQKQYLVALDLKSGEKVWEKKLDTVDGSIVFYLAHKGNKLVLVSSQKQYHVYAFRDKDGKSLWSKSFAWQNGDHGGHMSRPALVDNKVFVRPRVLDAKTGKLLPETLPRGGCGTYACTAQTLVFRAGNVTMWDLEKQRATSWTRLRPDCWLSTIPANGMLLSPEGGGGCSCGSWMETSVGFRPKSRK